MSGLTFSGLGALGGEQDLLAHARSLEAAAANWNKQVQGFMSRGISPNDPAYVRARGEVTTLLAQAAAARAAAAKIESRPVPMPPAPKAPGKKGPPSLSITTRDISPDAAPVPVSAPTAGGGMSMNVPAYQGGRIMSMISSLNAQREPLGPIYLPEAGPFPVIRSPMTSVSPWFAGAAGLLAFAGLYYMATR